MAAIEAAGKLGEIDPSVGLMPRPTPWMQWTRAASMSPSSRTSGQGEGGIQAAIALARGETVEQITWIPYELVTPENYKEYMK